MSGITVTMPIEEYERMKEENEHLKERNKELQHRSIYSFIELDYSNGGPYPNIGIHESKIREYVNKGYYTPPDRLTPVSFLDREMMEVKPSKDIKEFAKGGYIPYQKGGKIAGKEE